MINIPGRNCEATGSYAGTFKDAKLQTKLVRMNYDMHVGAVLGLPGKILAFFASLDRSFITGYRFYYLVGKKEKKQIETT